MSEIAPDFTPMDRSDLKIALSSRLLPAELLNRDRDFGESAMDITIADDQTLEIEGRRTSLSPTGIFVLNAVALAVHRQAQPVEPWRLKPLQPLGANNKVSNDMTRLSRRLNNIADTDVLVREGTDMRPSFRIGDIRFVEKEPRPSSEVELPDNLPEQVRHFAATAVRGHGVERRDGMWVQKDKGRASDTGKPMEPGRLTRGIAKNSSEQQAAPSMTSTYVNAGLVQAVVRPDKGWRKKAACRDEDPELFFPVSNTGPALEQIRVAKLVCGRCAVQSQCLTEAFEHGDAGIWGGMTEDERAHAKRRNPQPRLRTS